MKQRQYLKDYRPSAFRIPEIFLRLDIQKDWVDVSSVLHCERADNGVDDLVLDGRHMELLALSVNGQSLADGDYVQSEDSLTIANLPQRFELSITVRINPFNNTSLEGLYAAGGMLCTQCESHGFSRITYCLDRPDVMSVYTVEIEADKSTYPILLGNGNLSSSEELPDGRHQSVWKDPHPKPCYLFAAVAGDLAERSCQYTTSEGRDVRIGFYCDHGIEDQLEHAMDSLVRSMRWDEEKYGLPCDLDTYNVVVAGAFNMGAMENKGLNIFNPKYVLASPRTATDVDYSGIESVIGHEYFHNWTGNRVTCRDWFQLSLKEGLTVFRDQQFSADCGAGPVQRIEQVRLLRARQFSEDAGPLSHPVRPESYLEMNNFYTMTVYEKGAELVRLLHARVGEEGFRRGMDLYFERHDGQAVTIEDFLAAHGDANGIDTAGILRWYGQAGTPLVEIRDEYRDGQYTLHCRQSVPTNPGALPVLIPLRLSLLDDAGHRLIDGQVLEFDQAEQSFQFAVTTKPVPVLFEGFSAPVKWNYAYSHEQLVSILRHATDPFSRWEAAQRLYLARIDALYAGQPNGAVLPALSWLLDDAADGGVLAALLTPPQADELTDRYAELDPVRLAAAVESLKDELAQNLKADLPAAFGAVTPAAPYRFAPAAVSQRSLQARLLALWVRSGDAAALKAAETLFDAADNLTQRMAVLSALNFAPSALRDRLLERFYDEYRKDKLVLDRWFALQAQMPGEAGLQAVKDLLQHPDFEPTNPNRVRALLASFGMLNPAALYAANGEGIDLLMAQLQRFDSVNPQLASRLVAPCAVLAKLTGQWQSKMRQALSELKAQIQSPDLIEQVERILG